MKNVKVMLAGLAIVCAVGTSLAVKAEKFGTTIFTGTAANNCVNTLSNSTYTPNASATVFATTQKGGTGVKAVLSSSL